MLCALAYSRQDAHRYLHIVGLTLKRNKKHLRKECVGVISLLNEGDWSVRRDHQWTVYGRTVSTAKLGGASVLLQGLFAAAVTVAALRNRLKTVYVFVLSQLMLW